MDTVYQCGSCGFCLDTCCVYQATFTESVSPRGKLLLLKKCKEGVLTDPAPITNRVYTCTLCRKCEDACPSKTEITTVIKDWRNSHPHESLYKSVHSVLEHGNPYQRPQAEREKWLTSEQDENADTAFFPGCTTSLLQPCIAQSFLQVVNEPLQIIDDVCCGSVLSKTGFYKEAQEVMEKNIHYFKERGIKTLITSCAGCYSFFLEYPFSIKVLHTSQVLLDYLSKLQPQKMVTTYHDPCHLVTHALTAQPRYLLKTLSTYTEKESQVCCGAGGGMLLTSTELADLICKNLVKEFNPRITLVTACPFCLYHMKRNTLQKVLSIEEFAASCI